MQETCTKCNQTRGNLKVTHTWQPQFIGDDSNQKQNVCSRCQIKGEKWVTQNKWPWIFNVGHSKQKYIEMQRSVKNMVSVQLVKKPK